MNREQPSSSSASGPGNRTRPYCSRVCCTHTMENALLLRRANPDMPIYVLYRDIRTYGEREDLYTRHEGKGSSSFATRWKTSQR